MLSDEASKEELDSLVASGDAEILETVIEASDSEFDMSSQEAWGWFSSLFNSRYNRGNRDTMVVDLTMEDTDQIEAMATLI